MADTTQNELLILEKKLLDRQEKLEALKESLEKEQNDLNKKREEYKTKLEHIASLTKDEANAQLLSETEKDASAMMARIIKEKEEEAKATAKTKVQEILLDSIRHGALDYIPEYTVSMVKVESEDMKGRIIGKEGRNIRAFEQATGVDVDLDEEGAIKLSCFDSVRREVARRALEVLLKDSRIQPFRIEEVVAQTQKDVEKIMFEEGQKIAEEMQIFNLPTDLYGYLGRFKFRTSFGQNLVLHSLEVAKIGVAMAQELGADTDIVKLGGLFHDIGKIVEGEGGHVKLGVELLKKYNFPEAVINCVAEHHEDKPFSSVESVIVHIADKISAARPGARYSDIEEYGHRLTDMENLAKRYEGVEEAFAFEAGRELRVFINPGRLDDSQTVVMAKKIQEEVTKSMAVPGVVKVTAIREFRSTYPERE
jgi:ribonuclease Y